MHEWIFRILKMVSNIIQMGLMTGAKSFFFMKCISNYCWKCLWNESNNHSTNHIETDQQTFYYLRKEPVVEAPKNRFFSRKNIWQKRNFQVLLLYITAVFSSFFIKIHLILCSAEAPRVCGGKSSVRNVHLKQKTQKKFYSSIYSS